MINTNKAIEQQVKKILVHSKIHYLIQQAKAKERMEEQNQPQMEMPKQKMENIPLFKIALQNQELQQQEQKMVS